MLPSFMSKSTPVPSAPAPTAEAHPAPQAPQEAATVDPVEEPEPAVDPVEEPKAQASVEDSAEPTAQAPKPRVVEVTLPPLESEISVSPRALSALAQIDSLSPAQASVIVPLLTRLRKVRDRMSPQRKE